MALAPSDRLGPYQIVGLLGEGGMGAVYRARDSRLNRDVAIKVLLADVANDPERLARFRREAQVLASLNHPNIAHVYGLEGQAGQDGQEGREGHAGTYGIVMELVDGPTLAERIEQGPIPVGEALAIARQIAHALEAAHEQGVVHRDLKPANIKVRDDGMVKVLDFGLAKALDVAGVPAKAGTHEASESPTITSPAMTRAGIILGTAAYMSPEQARGRFVDKRTDIWAFGCVLYEMVTGQRAFGGDDVSETIASVLAREPQWNLVPAAVPPVAVLYLKRCLHRELRGRLRDIGDMQLALEGAFDSVPPAAHVATTPAAMWRRLLPATATAVVALAVGGLAASRLARQAPGTEAPTRFEVLLPAGEQIPINGRPMVAVAPDGRSFAYRTMSGLYVRGMADLEPRLVPGSVGAQAPFSQPFFSPDGQWIAYFTLTELRKVAVAGGESVALAKLSQAAGGSWFDDQHILVAERSGIVRIPASGGSPEVLIPARDGERMYGPQMLPDGAILFNATTSTDANRWEDAQILVQSPGGSERTIVAQGGHETRYLPEGFITYAQKGRLFALPFDLTRHAATGGAIPIVDNVDAPAGVTAVGTNYDIAKSGTLVYLVEDAMPRTMVWVDRHGTRVGAVPGAPPAMYEDPRISPDGRRLVVTRDGDIWIYEIDSGRSSRLTRNGSSLMGVWSPHGTEIAYSSNAPGGLEAWIAAADGSGEPRQLTHLGGIVHVDSWSPDGRTLSVHQHQGLQVRILMVALDRPSEPPQVFVSTQGVQAEGADFSRDGRNVVYLSTDAGQRDIYVRAFPGPSGHETASVNGGREPRWAGNGEIFYRSLDGVRMFSVRAITTPRLTLGRPEELFQGSFFIAPTGSPRPQYDVTPDGQRFLMLASTGNQTDGTNRPRFVVAQHWISELTRTK